MRRIQSLLFVFAILVADGVSVKAQFATGQAATVVLGQRSFTQANPNTVDWIVRDFISPMESP